MRKLCLVQTEVGLPVEFWRQTGAFRTQMFSGAYEFRSGFCIRIERQVNRTIGIKGAGIGSALELNRDRCVQAAHHRFVMTIRTLVQNNWMENTTRPL
ncbi:unnamed protein product [Danaus chrysippus]|uniref:(African queen) hypothetical protein n=1 Tax=Danaus chrysippus TaxID=151541 RepID=A0A8J2QP97_9NEOP|nr:unnamed protein product [Danaus chrysippus]